MKKAGIKAVSRADGVDSCDFWRNSFESLPAPARKYALVAALHDHQRNFARKKIQCPNGIINLRQARSFALVRQQHIHKCEHIEDLTVPMASGIVVRVQGSRKACLFCKAKEVYYAGTKSLLQVIGGEVQMTRLCDSLEIEVFETHLRHDARIGKDEALSGLRYDDRDSRLSTGKSSDARYVDAAFF